MPNLIVLPADELGITGRGDRRALRFASVLAARPSSCASTTARCPRS